MDVPVTSWQRSRASPDPIAATAPTAFAGPAPFRKWLPSTTEPRRLGVATDAEKSWPGVLVLAELKIEKGNLVECAAKGLGEAQDLESDASDDEEDMAEPLADSDDDDGDDW